MTAEELVKKIPRSLCTHEAFSITEKLSEVSDRTFKKAEQILYDQGYTLLGAKSSGKIELHAVPREFTQEEKPSWNKAKQMCIKYIQEHKTFPDNMKPEAISIIADHFMLIQKTIGSLELLHLRETQ